MRFPSLLLVSVALLTAASPALAARRIQSGTSASRATSSQTMKMTMQRALKRKIRAEQLKRETEGRPLSSSSSSERVGSYMLEQFSNASVLGKGQKAMLYFCASWSNQCQGMTAMLKNWGKARPFVIPLYVVDYDAFPDLKKKYDVRYENLFVYIDESGQKLKLQKAAPESWIKQLVYQELSD